MRLRHLFLLLVAIAVSPFVLFWTWSSIERTRLDRALDALEARHEPLDIAQFDPIPKTDEQRQASHYYRQASALLADLRPRWLTETARVIEDFCGTSDPVTRTGREASLRSLENRYEPALDLLDRATALDADGWDPKDKPDRTSVEANLPYELAGVNAARVARLACSGDGDAAAQALLASLRLRRVLFRWTTRPLQTSHGLQLVLNAGASRALLEQLQREYQAIAQTLDPEAGLRLARAQWLSYAQPGVFSEPPRWVAAQRLTPFQAIGLRITRPLRDHTVVAELHEFDAAIAAAREPWPRNLDETARIEREHPRSRSRANSLMNVVNPYGRHVALSQLQLWLPIAAETIARAHASIAALGVARWRLDHGGALPASLHELGPAYLSRPLIDPYSGSELAYTSDRGAYKVYSVGSNRRDDGGRWEQRSDLQFSRRGDPLDVGIAVNQTSKLR